MRTYRFTVKEHEEYGSMGFAPSWYPNGDPLGGMGVAHDILEHFPHDKGDAEGEYMATGAGLWIRGDTGYFTRNGNVNRAEVHLASEVLQTWDYLTRRDGRSTLRPCGLARNRNPELMEQCREIVRLAIQETEERGGINPLNWENRELIARWIARGYMRAGKRYRKTPAYQVAYDLFGVIEERADTLLKHAEEGMVLTVRLSGQHPWVTVDCDYPETYYNE